MQNSKNCIMCYSEIDSRAKKCPNCTSLQAKYSNLENNPILIGILGAMIIGIFGFIIYNNFYIRSLEEKAVNDLKVSVTDISSKIEGDTLYVACMGDIQNNSEFEFRDVKYQVDFFSDKNELVDTFTVIDEDIRLKAKSPTNFRVRGLAQKESTMYKNCVVKVADAWSCK